MTGTASLGRRGVLSLLGAAAAAGLLPGALPSAFAATGTDAESWTLGPPEPFSFDALVARARLLSQRPYRPEEPSPALKEALAAIDYDAYQKIAFKPERALWADVPGAPAIAPFHMHQYAAQPVRLHLVEDAQSRLVAYDPNVFTYGAGKPKQAEGLGWAGFRVLHADNPASDWLAFMGATYFRSAGPLNQYGQSARAVAVDTAMADRPERFPRFTDIWLEPRRDGGLIIRALIDGESLTGAFQAICEPPNGDSVVMEIATRFFTRTKVGRLGVAPMTSMFWFSETNRQEANDWRPEIHDTDGLALWTGAGERLWRPLDNPTATRVSTFVDSDPRGFGLLQRDRAFTNYEDDGVFYEKRAGLWIEPRHPWGEGGVQLVEIPTDDEIHDNIVAYWTTDREIPAGTALAFDYRLSWVAAPVLGPMEVGHVVATRLGRAGVPGQPRPADGAKYVIDFEGGDLAAHTSDDGTVSPEVGASNARIDNAYALRVVGTDRWRLVFDLYPDHHGAEVDLRAYLRAGETPLTETWIFKHRDPGFGPR